MTEEELKRASMPLTMTELKEMLKRYEKNPEMERVIGAAITRRLTGESR